MLDSLICSSQFSWRLQSNYHIPKCNMQCKVYWPGRDSLCLFLSVSSQSRELHRALPADSKERIHLSSPTKAPLKCHKLTPPKRTVKIEATVLYHLMFQWLIKNNITESKKDTNQVDNACSTFNSSCFKSCVK